MLKIIYLKSHSRRSVLVLSVGVIGRGTVEGEFHVRKRFEANTTNAGDRILVTRMKRITKTLQEGKNSFPHFHQCTHLQVCLGFFVDPAVKQ